MPGSLLLGMATAFVVPTVVAAPTQSSAEQYYVGKRWPTVPFEVPESWAGLIPIDEVSSARSKGNDYFFWYFHGDGDCASKDDLIVWTNGGPGCSSLEGLLQENGPVLFPFNVSGEVENPYVELNPYSWTKLADVVWVDQPIGTGFSTGSVDAKGYADEAAEFFSFLQHFYETFPENKGKKLWITGESAAGEMIPYMAEYIYNHPEESKNAGIDLKGISINDPTFTNDFFLQTAPIVPFVKRWHKELALPNDFLKSFYSDAELHGLSDYVEKNLVYPPPKYGLSMPDLEDFHPWDDVYDQSAQYLSYFNVYNVNESDYIQDPLGFSPSDTDSQSSKNIVNDIPGFKELIHAPNETWTECSSRSVYAKNGPTGEYPDVSILPNVIEKSERTLIQHGTNDFLLMANGSALAIQNMTWGGNRGFQTKPSGVLRVNGKDSGQFHAERGLSYIQVYDSGHMIPQDQPAVSFKNTQYLLGQIGYEELGQDSSTFKCSAKTS